MGSTFLSPLQSLEAPQTHQCVIELRDRETCASYSFALMRITWLRLSLVRPAMAARAAFIAARSIDGPLLQSSSAAC